LIGTVLIPVNTSNAFLIIISVLLGLAIFGSVIFMCQMHSHLKEKETGVMRKTIAGLLVIGLVVVIFFALTTKIENEGLITQYIQLVGIIIAFYFGSRSAGSAVEAATAENKRKDEAAAEKIKKADAAASEAKKLEKEAAATELKKNDEVAVAEAKKV
jgi:Na+/proline symporter